MRPGRGIPSAPHAADATGAAFDDPWAGEAWAEVLPGDGAATRAPHGVPGSAPVPGRGGAGDETLPPGPADPPYDDDLWAAAAPAPGAAARRVPAEGQPYGDDPWPEDDLWPEADLWAGEAGSAAGAAVPMSVPGLPAGGEDARAIASWDRDLDALEGELRRARAAVRDVELPSALSASQLLRLAADEQGFVRDLARPMPRPPQPAARQGTRFHAWVESRFDELPLPFLDVLDPVTDLPGAGSDQEIADEADLDSLKAAFERSPYADRPPHRMEAPVQLTLAGRVVRGRIDAVYRNEDGSYEIVDWKTGRTTEADPLQLAVYRVAWAETTNTPLDQVSAAFLHVRSGRVIRPRNLPDRARLERILQGEPDPDGDHQADS
ncbi:hypothetical protein DEJ51_22015 [Streptomyces venezuelae]|uniref:PD-(D/E)XK endonuclease-like domain-containing protein n=1 Tax=Streptomyces venezuelae TaxID=54571 RepID=A0A5P2DVC3_STRVZ|nr:hypothetical protein DEJ51_22015 [Streptomyces venezuelae]